MIEIIFGTKNPAKVEHVRVALEPFGIKVRDLTGFEDLPEVDEDGETPEENAEAKARAYCQSIGRPVLAMDNALYLDGLPDNLQPGTHVRRIPGHSGRPSDVEALEYYKKLIDEHGGTMTGHWKFALCLVFPSGQLKKATAISKIREFRSRGTSKMMPGYPLESIQFDPESGKFIAEMTKAESDKLLAKSIEKELKEIFDSQS